jgi:hypothetical protein
MPFVKGRSGNPHGGKKRAPILAEIEELARRAAPDAIDRLMHFLKDSDGRISIAAAKVLLDRGFGTPQQTITATVTDERTVIRAPEPAQTAEEWRASLPKPH